ncbi:hypothetical protein Stsp02_62090 [Streptomyces sp. NBRC 14336]|uniref:hypothetical protein n=1 Tax=Streptomyces sp. NBRC 14336 TaxID=3030992 RepID=UPI0024A53985|nr:hypothetical protein [Streptomyces sp. NBRC 14336]GLW50548.1 hypothetical protein Stsp02_62090 [Streptomyces sp. NBRC 14336]
MTRPRHPAWFRTVVALCLADTRRRLNLLAGTGPSARRRRKAAWTVAGAGAAAVLGALTVVGRTLGALAPPGPEVRTELAAWTWAPVAVWFLHRILTAEPAKARALVSPPDADVLRTLPVSRAQLVTARLVLPAAGIAAAVLCATAAIGVPWLAADAEGRRMLPVFLVHCAGAAVAGTELHIALVTALMVRVVRIPHLPRLIVSAVAGGLAGVLAAPFVQALTGGDGPSREDAARSVGRALTDARPELWTEAHRPESAAWTALAYAAVTLALAAAAVLRVRATVRRDAGTGEGRPAVAPRRGAATGAWPSSPYALVGRVTWLRFRRGHPQTVGGLARLQRLGVLLGAGCLGLVLSLGEPLWNLPFAAVGGIFVAAALITTGEVVQVCGIEADRAGWEALRQSPRAAGGWVAAKAATASVAVATVTGPFALGAAALCGVHGPAGWARAVLALAVVSAAAGCAVVLTYFCVPRSESFADGRITRAPAAEVTEGLLTALLTVPVTAGAALGDLAHAALLLLSLGAGYAALRATARNDFSPRSSS